MIVPRLVPAILGLLPLLIASASGQEATPRDRAASSAAIEDTADLQARASARAVGYATERGQVRLTLGITQRGRRWVRGFGPDRPEAAGTPDGQVIYEIGSITKVFTGVVLARAERDGRVRLETTVGDLLPPGAEAPNEVRAITLGQLSTHTSGLPRMPGNFGLRLLLNVENPYARYTPADLLASLRSAKLDRPAGTKSEYSNYGAGLLGYLLALDAGRSYEALVREAVAGPLRMADTTVALSESQRARLVRGRAPGGRPVPGWDFDALAAAGALHSTVDDMLTFLEANLHPADDPTGLALRRAQEVHFGRGPGPRLGLGWQVLSDPSGQAVHWHNGGTGGYRSFCGFVDGQDSGIVLLSNTGDAMRGDDALDRIGLDLLRLAVKVSLATTP